MVMYVNTWRFTEPIAKTYMFRAKLFKGGAGGVLLLHLGLCLLSTWSGRALLEADTFLLLFCFLCLALKSLRMGRRDALLSGPLGNDYFSTTKRSTGKTTHVVLIPNTCPPACPPTRVSVESLVLIKGVSCAGSPPPLLQGSWILYRMPILIMDKCWNGKVHIQAWPASVFRVIWNSS